MKKVCRYIIFFILLNSCSIFAQTFSKIKIYNVSDNIIASLAGIGLPIEESFYNKDENSIEIFVDEDQYKQIIKFGYVVEKKIADVSKWFEERNEIAKKQLLKISQQLPKGFFLGSMGGHPTIEEYISMIDTMHYLYPNLVISKESLGKTYEKRDIFLIRISNYSISKQKEKVLFTGLHHAREGTSLTSLLYYMFYILENYGKDPIITFLLDNRELYFIPMLNPDGYAYNQLTNPAGGGMWRKNRTPYYNDYGVDLNRNYGYMWGFDDIGSSPQPSYSIYRGPKPFSENETKIVKKLCEDNSFISAVNYHTYGNLIVFPWNYINLETEDTHKYRYISSIISNKTFYKYGNAFSTVNYSTNGDSDDWMYGDIENKNKIIAFTLEIGSYSDYFWAPIDRIKPISDEVTFSNNYITLTSGGFIDSLVVMDNRYLLLNDTGKVSLSFFNHGLKDIDSCIVSISTLDSNLYLLNNDFIIEKINSFTLSEFITFYFTFKKNTPSGYCAKYKITANYNGFPFEKEFFVTKINSKPVSYESFNVKQEKNKVLINWTTNFELKHKGFFIYRKSKNESFSEIGLVPSKGEKGGTYSFIDYPKETGAYTYKIITYDDDMMNSTFERNIMFKLYPMKYSLSQNYPNPSNPETTINFTIPYETKVELSIYNILGEKLQTIINDTFNEGSYNVKINMSKFPSQVYFYELKTNDYKEIKKMLLLK